MRAYTRITVGALTLALVVLTLLVLHGPDVVAQPTRSAAAEEARFLQSINDYREANGLQPLLLSETLSVAARRHSEDMGRYDFVAHDTVRSSYYPAGSSFDERMAAEGYDYDTFRAENIAAGMPSAQEALDGWRSSPAHDGNMLDPGHRVIGIGLVEAPGSRYGWYWTTGFGAEVDPSVDAESSEEPGSRAGGEAPSLSSEDRAEPGWTEHSRAGREIVSEGRARLGGYEAARDVLERPVRLGEEPRLRYELRALGGEASAGRLEVQLMDREGERVATLKVHSGADEALDEEIGLSRFAGQRVTLRFVATTGSDSPPTGFVLDEVSVEDGVAGEAPVRDAESYSSATVIDRD